MTRSRSMLRRRAMCPDCGRVTVWLGEVFAAHRRAAAPTRARPGAGLDIGSHSARRSVDCEGAGQPIEDRHLRGE